MTLFGGPDRDDTPNDVDDGRPAWAEVRGTRQRCDACVARALHDRTHTIGRARWRRRQHGRDRLLCAEHAHEERIQRG